MHYGLGSCRSWAREELNLRDVTSLCVRCVMVTYENCHTKLSQERLGNVPIWRSCNPPGIEPGLF